jgi:hypothetical protein
MDMQDPIPYREAFPAGTEVRIADRAILQNFMATWNYHHKLQAEQLVYADRTTKVEEVGFFHGGGIPGLWLEQCLRPIE